MHPETNAARLARLVQKKKDEKKEKKEKEIGYARWKGLTARTTETKKKVAASSTESAGPDKH